MESGLGSIGAVGAVLIILFAVAAILMPFFIWGIYNQTHKTASEMVKIRKLLEQPARQQDPGGQAPTEPAPEPGMKVGLFD